MIRSRHIDEVHVPGCPLGRHVHHDPQSRDYKTQIASAIASVRHASIGLPLTQTVSSCTAEALVGCCNTSPNMGAGSTFYDQDDAMKLYGVETKMEGQPYPPNDPGGSGLMVCKAAVSLNMIVRYEHAFSVQEALGALMSVPVITGVNWYTSFDTPDASGLVDIAPRARVRGGHEFMADEIDAQNELVWFMNSWSFVYGKDGRFAMRFSTWDRLLAEEGDVTVPIVH